MKSARIVALLALAACGGKSMDPPTGSASSTAGDTRPLPGDPACEVPAGVATTQTSDGCYATVLSITVNGTPGNVCAANQFGLICQGPNENASGSPGPAPALGCAPPVQALYLPLNLSEYCCPCAPGSIGNSSGSNGDAGSSGSGVTCTAGPGSGGGSSGGDSCTLQASETCSDGTTYQIACDCPAATCTCAEQSGQSGGSGGGVTFSACAESCSSASAGAGYEACGFPH